MKSWNSVLITVLVVAVEIVTATNRTRDARRFIRLPQPRPLINRTLPQRRALRALIERGDLRIRARDPNIWGIGSEHAWRLRGEGHGAIVPEEPELVDTENVQLTPGNFLGTHKTADFLRLSTWPPLPDEEPPEFISNQPQWPVNPASPSIDSTAPLANSEFINPPFRTTNIGTSQFNQNADDQFYDYDVVEFVGKPTIHRLVKTSTAGNGPGVTSQDLIGRVGNSWDRFQLHKQQFENAGLTRAGQQNRLNLQNSRVFQAGQATGARNPGAILSNGHFLQAGGSQPNNPGFNPNLQNGRVFQTGRSGASSSNFNQNFQNNQFFHAGQPVSAHSNANQNSQNSQFHGNAQFGTGRNVNRVLGSTNSELGFLISKNGNTAGNVRTEASATPRNAAFVDEQTDRTGGAEARAFSRGEEDNVAGEPLDLVETGEFDSFDYMQQKIDSILEEQERRELEEERLRLQRQREAERAAAAAAARRRTTPEQDRTTATTRRPTTTPTTTTRTTTPRPATSPPRRTTPLATDVRPSPISSTTNQNNRRIVNTQFGRIDANQFTQLEIDRLTGKPQNLDDQLQQIALLRSRNAISTAEYEAYLEQYNKWLHRPRGDDKRYPLDIGEGKIGENNQYETENYDYTFTESHQNGRSTQSGSNAIGVQSGSTGSQGNQTPDRETSVNEKNFDNTNEQSTSFQSSQLSENRLNAQGGIRNNFEENTGASTNDRTFGSSRHSSKFTQSETEIETTNAQFGNTQNGQSFNENVGHSAGGENASNQNFQDTATSENRETFSSEAFTDGSTTVRQDVATGETQSTFGEFLDSSSNQDLRGQANSNDRSGQEFGQTTNRQSATFSETNSSQGFSDNEGLSNTSEQVVAFPNLRQQNRPTDRSAENENIRAGQGSVNIVDSTNHQFSSFSQSSSSFGSSNGDVVATNERFDQESSDVQQGDRHAEENARVGQETSNDAGLSNGQASTIGETSSSRSSASLSATDIGFEGFQQSAKQTNHKSETGNTHADQSAGISIDQSSAADHVSTINQRIFNTGSSQAADTSFETGQVDQTAQQTDQTQDFGTGDSEFGRTKNSGDSESFSADFRTFGRSSANHTSQHTTTGVSRDDSLSTVSNPSTADHQDPRNQNEAAEQKQNVGGSNLGNVDNSNGQTFSFSGESSAFNQIDSSNTFSNGGSTNLNLSENEVGHQTEDAFPQQGGITNNNPGHQGFLQKTSHSLLSSQTSIPSNNQFPPSVTHPTPFPNQIQPSSSPDSQFFGVVNQTNSRHSTNKQSLANFISQNNRNQLVQNGRSSDNEFFVSGGVDHSGVSETELFRTNTPTLTTSNRFTENSFPTNRNVATGTFKNFELPTVAPTVKPTRITEFPSTTASQINLTEVQHDSRIEIVGSTSPVRPAVRPTTTTTNPTTTSIPTTSNTQHHAQVNSGQAKSSHQQNVLLSSGNDEISQRRVGNLFLDRISNQPFPVTRVPTESTTSHAVPAQNPTTRLQYFTFSTENHNEPAFEGDDGFTHPFQAEYENFTPIAPEPIYAVLPNRNPTEEHSIQPENSPVDGIFDFELYSTREPPIPDSSSPAPISKTTEKPSEYNPPDSTNDAQAWMGHHVVLSKTKYDGETFSGSYGNLDNEGTTRGSTTVDKIAVVDSVTRASYVPRPTEAPKTSEELRTLATTTTPSPVTWPQFPLQIRYDDTTVVLPNQLSTTTINSDYSYLSQTPTTRQPLYQPNARPSQPTYPTTYASRPTNYAQTKHDYQNQKSPLSGSYGTGSDETGRSKQTNIQNSYYGIYPHVEQNQPTSSYTNGYWQSKQPKNQLDGPVQYINNQVTIPKPVYPVPKQKYSGNQYNRQQGSSYPKPYGLQPLQRPYNQANIAKPAAATNPSVHVFGPALPYQQQRVGPVRAVQRVVRVPGLFARPTLPVDAGVPVIRPSYFVRRAPKSNHVIGGTFA